MDAEKHKEHLKKQDEDYAFEHVCDVCKRLLDEQRVKDERQGELDLDGNKPKL